MNYLELVSCIPLTILRLSGASFAMFADVFVKRRGFINLLHVMIVIE